MTRRGAVSFWRGELLQPPELNGLAELRPPRAGSLIMPFQNIEFALIGPVFRAGYITVAYRIVFHIFPFFSIRFSTP